MYIFGIDIGGTFVKIGFFNSEYVLLDKWQIPTNKKDDGSYILNDIYDSIIEYLSRKDIDINDVKGYGFGIPGPVVGSDVELCVNLGWHDVNVRELFDKAFHSKAKFAVINDAKAAALGEFYCNGNGKNTVMVTLGTGFGCGIILDGKVLGGASGCAGEIGHVKIDDVYNFPCNCGASGCVETVCSATGLGNIFRKNYDNYNTSLGLDATARDIIQGAMNKDELSLVVVDELCDYIGRTLSIIAGVVNPDLFIVGGGLSNAGEFILSKIKESFLKYALGLFSKTEIVLASLSNDAGIYGTSHLI